MRRITVSLTDELAGALSRESRRRELPASAIVRNALSAYLGVSNLAARRELPFASVGCSGRRTTAREIEELLGREWSTDRRRG